MQRFILSAFALALVAALAPVTCAQNGAGPSVDASGAGRAFSMGFVDMEELIKQHPLTAAKTESFQREFESRMEGLRGQFSEMNSLKEAIEVHVAGSPEHLAALKRIKKIEATLELERKIIRIEFQLKVVGALKEVYKKCKIAVNAVAEARQLSAIAMISSSEVGGRTRAELVGDILTRPFIYAAPGLDITDEVLARMGVVPKKK